MASEGEVTILLVSLRMHPTQTSAQELGLRGLFVIPGGKLPQRLYRLVPNYVGR